MKKPGISEYLGTVSGGYIIIEQFFFNYIVLLFDQDSRRTSSWYHIHRDIHNGCCIKSHWLIFPVTPYCRSFSQAQSGVYQSLANYCPRPISFCSFLLVASFDLFEVCFWPPLSAAYEVSSLQRLTIFFFSTAGSPPFESFAPSIVFGVSVLLYLIARMARK